MRTPILLALGIAALAVAACDQRQLPTVAGLGGTTTSGSNGGGTNSGGSTTGNSAPLAITPNSLQLPVGTTFAFNTNAPASFQSQLEWRSAQPTIATVNNTGVVTAIAPGTAIIIARYTFDTTQSASATVNVTGTASNP